MMQATMAKENRRRSGPKTRDKHALYEMSVQSPEENIKFFERVYKKHNGCLPLHLKEDFCGTALLCAAWVARRPDNVAVGVDLDRSTLQWGREHNITPLGDAASRVSLVNDDVRSVRSPKVDVVAALNFSYFIFKKPSDLSEYFRAARASLRPGGMLVLDMFGGWEAQMNVTDTTRYKGFTYVWEQDRFDPITNETRFHIHFRFHGGGGIRKAFTYDWRLWSVPEVREALADAGFAGSQVYWEGVDSDTDEGNGVFRPVNRAENCPGWNAFVTAW